MGYVTSGTGQAEKVSDLVIVRMRQPFAFRMVDPWSEALVVPFATSVQLILINACVVRRSQSSWIFA